MTFFVRPRRAAPLTEEQVARALYPFRRPLLPPHKNAPAQSQAAGRRTTSVHHGRQ